MKLNSTAIHDVIKKSSSILPTKHGKFTISIYQDRILNTEHAVLVMGNVTNSTNVVTRVHSECLTGDVFGSRRCDCGEQLDASLERIAANGHGVLIYLRGQEGRGIGLGNKIAAYTLQDTGMDTVEANEALGLPVDARKFDAAKFILNDLGIQSIHLITNNPKKVEYLLSLNVRIEKVLPIQMPSNPDNANYLLTKQQKLGHSLKIPNVSF